MNPLVEYPRTMDLAYWINEREAMRQRRAAGIEAPWTSDPDMANVRYCNVHREDDKVTKWLRTNGVYSGVGVPVWVTVLCRMVNRITTLAALSDAVAVRDHTEIKALLKHLRTKGAIWGNAYTISTCGKVMDKVDYVLDHVVHAVSQSTFIFDTLASTHRQLMRIDGLGSFLAAQVVADLKNTPGHPLQAAPDWWTWAAPGPGSIKGLVAYFGTVVPASQFAGLLATATQQVTPLIANYVAPIHAQDMQNCFCEFSKYIRVREGGRARNNYDAYSAS